MSVAPPAAPRALRSLSTETLDQHAARVRVPTYDRTRLQPAVVHLGVGAFHRAHQAVYFDELAERGLSDWGIVGVAMRRPDMRDALAPQDGLYTLVERGTDGDRARIVGSILDVLHAPSEPGRVLDALTDARTKLVTITVTGVGYHVDAQTGELVDDEETRADLAHPDAPRTAIGFLTEALARRRAAGLAPFAVLSCDNVPENGRTARAAVLAMARRRGDEELATHVAREVAFPSSMVDRITPATTDDVRATVTDDLGIDDRWPVATEPFSQWIVEDRFGDAERPPLERVGVQLTGDVTSYELMKKRLLNGSHVALGFVGSLLGHRDTVEALRDPLVRAYLARLMADEVAPALPSVPGIDLTEYQATLLDRFANARMPDQLIRLCRRGSSKVPAHLLPSLTEARTAGRPHELLTLAAAAWVRYLQGVDIKGNEIPIQDPRLDELQPLAREAGSDPEPVITESNVFGWLADDPLLVESVRRVLARLDADGLRATVDAYVHASDPRSPIPA